MRAKDLMSAQPAVVNADEELSRAAALMRERNVGMLPVVSDVQSMTLVGVITDRDIAIRCVGQRHFGGCAVRDHMTRGPLVTVHPEDGAELILERMDRARVRRLPVVNDASTVIGVIAQADLVRKLYHERPGGVVEVIQHVSMPSGV